MGPEITLTVSFYHSLWHEHLSIEDAYAERNHLRDYRETTQYDSQEHQQSLFFFKNLGVQNLFIIFPAGTMHP